MDRQSLGRVVSGTLAVLLCACTGSISTPRRDGLVGPDGAPIGTGGASSPQGGGPLGGASGGAAGNAGGGAGNAGGGGDNVGETAGMDPQGNPLTCMTPEVGVTAMRRLTHREYNNAVRDLLGVTSSPANEFPPDSQIGLFDNTTTAQTVSQLLGDQYVDTAVGLAEEIGDVNALAGCDVGSGDTCVRAFVERFGRRAYRRPLTTVEVDGLMAKNAEARGAVDAATGVRAVVASVLSSPNFLFKPEFGGDASTLPEAKQATSFELAGRLASLLWASVPDDALLDAATNGELVTREQVAEQARRMLDDDNAHAAINAFYEQWLGLPLLDSAVKDADAFPDWSDGLRDAMREETRRFIHHVLWDGDAKLSTLFTAPYSFLNASLAELYGAADGPDSDSTFAMTALDPAQRAGVLTQGAFMSSFANPQFGSPIKRGKWVRTRMLCQELPDPPANVPAPPAPAPNVSTRERFEMHTNSPACAGCHVLIDGLGFGLENFDGIGKYRTTDNGQPVDAKGRVNESDVDEEYVGGVQLAALLARSGQARDCLPSQWLRYALAREEEDEDTCSLVGVRQAFEASGGDMRELMVALTQTDAFMNYRQGE
jgi:hypothetical protein